MSDKDLHKVKTLVACLSQFYWSKQLPQFCVLPDGSGIGRIAYDDIQAFSLAWCYHLPEKQAGHERAIVTSVMLRKVLDNHYGPLKLREAVAFLSKDAFDVWLKRHKQEIDPGLFGLLHKASDNRGKF